MFSVHATKKLLDRIKQRPQEPVAEPSATLGNWYATLVGWRAPLVLFVNEQTLLPVLVPLAPAASLTDRFRDHLAELLRALGVGEDFITHELAAMGGAIWAKTANRSITGTMNEFVFIADAWRERGRPSEPLSMSLQLSDVPCRVAARSGAVFPGPATIELVERWRAGELVPRAETGPAPAPAPRSAPSVNVPVRDRVRSADLTELDVERAIGRIAARDLEGANEARNVYDTLTWGEGPGQISQSGVQEWLWYRLPTKYMTDEIGYMTRLAAQAAALFDELGLELYAAICRSTVTSDVHAAFEESEARGYSAMRKALDGSGVEPPDTSTFSWSSVMGIEEALARATMQLRLEDSIADGVLDVGAKGWRSRQQQLAEEILDEDHPTQPGQTWRTAILTERFGRWVDESSRRSPELGRLHSSVANRLLHPVEPPPNLTEHMAPLTWLLGVFGEQQPLTDAGYLKPAFVVAVHRDKPWVDEFDSRPPRTEPDEPMLHRLHEFLVRAGALRKQGRSLRRTRLGAEVINDPARAWQMVVDHVAAPGWPRFVTEQYGLLLLERRSAVHHAELDATVAELATASGWRTNDSPLSQGDVARGFSDSRAILRLLGLLEVSGDWREPTYRLTPAGETTMLAILRATASGPRSRP